MFMRILEQSTGRLTEIRSLSDERATERNIASRAVCAQTRTFLEATSRIREGAHGNGQ